MLLIAFYASWEGKEHWYHRQVQLVDGSNLAEDESYKITEAMGVSNGKANHGVYTTLNKNNQMVLQVKRSFNSVVCLDILASATINCALFLIRWCIFYWTQLEQLRLTFVHSIGVPHLYVPLFSAPSGP